MSEYRSHQEAQLTDVLNDPAFALQVIAALRILDLEEGYDAEILMSCQDFLDIWGIVDLY